MSPHGTYRPTRPWHRTLALATGVLLVGAGLVSASAAQAASDSPIATEMTSSSPGRYGFKTLAPAGPGDTLQIYDPGNGCGWSAKAYAWLDFGGDSAPFPLAGTTASWCTYLIPADQETPSDWLPGTSVRLVLSDNPSFEAAAFAQNISLDGSEFDSRSGAGWTGVPAVPATEVFTSAPAPTITGSLAIGSVLTAHPGVFVPEATAYTYQWLNGTNPIAGATSETYTITAADAGKALRVSVTGTRSSFIPKSTTSAKVTAEKALTRSPAPKISGTVKVGSTLTASAGTWAPKTVTLRYQWNRSGVAINGARSAKYKLAAADLAANISVSVTGSKTGYTKVTTISSATAAVAPAALTAKPKPTITGKAMVGQVLTARSGTWKPATVTRHYQWKRAGVAIEGATASKYRLVAEDMKSRITVTVTGSKLGYTTAEKTSAATAIVVGKPLTATPVPRITGKATVGTTLTASAGIWSPSPVELSYQWKRSGVVIVDATTSTYELGLADKGKKITVVVKGTKTGYASVSKTSKATATVK